MLWMQRRVSGHLLARGVVGRGVTDKGKFALGFADQAGVCQVEEGVIQAELSTREKAQKA